MHRQKHSKYHSIIIHKQKHYHAQTKALNIAKQNHTETKAESYTNKSTLTQQIIIVYTQIHNSIQTQIDSNIPKQTQVLVVSEHGVKLFQSVFAWKSLKIFVKFGDVTFLQ